MYKIFKYNILEKIAETYGSIIYKASKENDHNFYAIKELKSSNLQQSEIARFKHEYEIIKKLNIEGVIKTYEILEYGNKIALVLEYFEGNSLKNIMYENKGDLLFFLNIAIKISSVLANLHKENVIHKDIKPNNILYNPETDEIKITDFGISNELTQVKNEVYNPHVIEGTLLYMSPEQTGRMNRNLDYRTDMYSLGITLYELLTGHVPFYSKDPMEIIHYHIAKRAKPVHEVDANIPEIISKIIQKLISKRPEDRYQNCFGVFNDLKECSNQLQNKGKIDNFKIGLNDISPFFIIPQLLIGREKEIDLLLSAVERISNISNKSEMIFVSGSPGIGKSSVINEIHKSILPKRGFFITGKYDQFRRDVPHSAIIQAFLGLINQILLQSDEMIEQWKEKFLQALGPNGRVISDVIPDIELIIGEQPEVPQLSAEQNQNRFNYVFRNFVSVIANENHPLVLFLDDLQWIDLASLNLIDLIISDSDIKHFLIISSYRDNNLDDINPLLLTLSDLQKKDVKINHIHLEELEIDDVNEMVSYFLSCNKKKAQPLAKLVHAKTNGNPFFINQFMKTIFDENLLKLNPLHGWEWDVSEIKKLQITDNVVELMADKMTKLPGETLEVLKICSCIGNRFKIDTIAKIYSKTVAETFNEISVALSEGLLQFNEDIYSFQHDRIQEAAYFLIPKEQKDKWHYRIGNLILEHTEPENLQNVIHYIVDQLNESKNLITSQPERINLAQLNLSAGIKAMSSAAYKSALIYFKSGIDLLNFDDQKEHNCWTHHYDLALSLYSNSAEASYLNGDLDGMNLFSEIVLNNSQSFQDSIKVYEIQMHSLMGQNKLQEAVDIGLDALKKVGIQFPKKPGNHHIMISLLKTMFMIRGKSPESLMNIPLVKDPLKLSTVRLLSSMSSLVYWTEPKLTPLIIFMLVRMTLKNGNSSESPFAYIAYGFFQCFLGKIDEGYNYGKLGLSVVEKKNFKEKFTLAHFSMNAFVRHWKEHIRNTIEPLYVGYQRGMDIGDLEFAAHCLMLNVWYKLHAGYELKSLKESIAKFGSILKKIKQETQLNIIKMVDQFVEILTNESDKPYLFKGSIYDSEKMLKIHADANDRTSIAGLYLCRMELAYLFNDYEMGVQNAVKFKPYLESIASVYTFGLSFFYDSLNHLALYENSSWFRKKMILRRIRSNQKKVKKWIKYNDKNHINKFYLVHAEYCRVTGNHNEAIKCYNKSIELARNNRFIVEEAMANECAAEFWIKKNEMIYAGVHVKAALDCYNFWGATSKVSHLKMKYEKIINQNISLYENVKIYDEPSKSSSTRNTEDNLDLSTVMKASLTISSEIVLERLLEKMMNMVLANAGAQKGFLILENYDDNKLYIEAQGAVDEEVKVMESVPLGSGQGFSVSIVNLVNKTKKYIVLNNACEEGDFVKDNYIVNNNIKSILCMPIIHKGISSGILYLENNLVTNAFTNERLELLQILSAQAAISIMNAKLLLHRENSAKLEKEMEIATQIQTGLLPKSSKIEGYDIYTYMNPAYNVGGDYYDVINSDGRDWVIIGDVSGHGVPAGLIMMMVQTCIQHALRTNPGLSPSELLRTVNETITKNIEMMGEFLYMTIVVLVTEGDGKFIFSGLHRDILIYRKKTNSVELIETKGLWLGMNLGDTTESIEQSFHLDKEDKLLLYTDGIVEAWEEGSIKGERSMEKEMFGVEKLIKIFSEMGTENSEDTIKGIIKSITNYEINDDVTMVAMKRL